MPADPARYVCPTCGPGPVNYSDPLTCGKCGRVISAPSFTAHPLRLHASWESYRRVVIPPDAPPVQVIESRRAFYAGAQAFMTICAASPDNGEDQVVNGLCAELKQFGDDVTAGKA